MGGRERGELFRKEEKGQKKEYRKERGRGRTGKEATAGKIAIKRI